MGERGAHNGERKTGDERWETGKGRRKNVRRKNLDLIWQTLLGGSSVVSSTKIACGDAATTAATGRFLPCPVALP